MSVPYNKRGSPTYEQHILEILERARKAVSQAQRQIAVSQKLHRDAGELLDKINASYQIHKKNIQEWEIAVAIRATTRP